tara:strand:- start:342 stop:956 length:615 start_codon:yes stop_codon:yes gene_type:complete
MSYTPLQEFQKLIGVTPDNDFGKVTLKAGIDHLKLTKEQGAHFFAQVAHESGNFKVTEENLRYSAKGLLKTFGKYFDEKTAKEYAMKPREIANKVYANRMGNGNEASGDGWKYRGRGFLQLTGKNNYNLFAGYIGDKLLFVDALSDKYAMNSAMYFFKHNNLFELCNKVNDTQIKMLTRRVNGGYNGLEHRKQLTHKYYEWLTK